MYFNTKNTKLVVKWENDKIKAEIKEDVEDIFNWKLLQIFDLSIKMIITHFSWSYLPITPRSDSDLQRLRIISSLFIKC